MEKALTESGAKAHQRNDSEDRSKEFRDFHRSLDRSLYAIDVDLVEWRFINGELTPVATIEITRVDNKQAATPQYLNQIIQRFDERDMQAKAAEILARKLEVKAWIVLFSKGCEEFWVYCLSDRSIGWRHFDKNRLEKWLQALGSEKRGN